MLNEDVFIVSGLRSESEGDLSQRPVLRAEMRLQGAVQTREQRGELNRDLIAILR